ncbi:MAG: carbohydrate porin [Xanthobacteraceae bacterium]|nr:carbohydrate porin [Xanthobacteraceae bacterium]
MTRRSAIKVAVGLTLASAAWSALPANAADAPVQLPVKARPAPEPTPTFDWTGWYFGGHYGYATGYSRWNATEAGAAVPTLSGSVDLTNPLSGYFGDGSYFGGLQAGYNQKLGQRIVLGAEADFMFPSFPVGLLGAQIFTSPLVGQASYQDTVAYSGTIRARMGYVLDNNWLLYGTGGFAFAYDKLQRTQLLGMPVNGTAQEGSFQNGFMWRLGWVAGAGVELPIAPNWTAKVEYQYARFGNSSVFFPDGAQVFNSNLAMQSVRVGFNYQIGDTSKLADFVANGPTAIEEDRFALHGQVTFVEQYAPQYRSPYVGPNSLIPNQGRETSDTTFYIGARLWQGAEFWINPEVDQGFGLSNTLGVAGFTSAEAYKVGNDYPYARVPRAFIRQTINLGGEVQKVDAGINQFSGTNNSNRLVITLGKISISDIFDDNRYAHDPRNDFLNWALVDAGTFDYVADAWGYTYGGSIEWYTGPWTFTAGIFDAPIVPNNVEVDPHFNQFQTLFEVSHRHEFMGQPGEVTITGWFTRARLGNYNDATALAQLTGGTPNLAAVRQYTTRSGIAANFEQQITPVLGVFMRTGLASPNIEPDAFTDIDRTVAGGAVFSGKSWGRPDDVWAVAGIVNNISTSHQIFLNNGGLGILVGDGQLPHPGLEQILETYYQFPLATWRVTFDYQLVDNPGYNRDRGPVSVFSTRLHMQF